MKSLRIVLLLFLSAILFSCNPEKNVNNIIEITENQINPNNVVFFDSIMKITKYIRLSTPKGLYIGEISKVIFSKDMIFVCDQKVMNTIFAFDYNGNYKYHLAGGGKGPGEFIRIQSISCDFTSNQCYVLDDKTGQVLVFDVNGKWIKSIKIKFTSYDLISVSDKTIAYCSAFPALETNANGYDLVFTNLKGKVTNYFLKIEPWRLQTNLIKNSVCITANS